MSRPAGKKYMLYARVSPKGSDWSAEETSIAVQLSDMRAKILSLDPRAEFIEVADEFRSGKDLNRPGVQRILGDLQEMPCPWQCLVVWNLDRLSRSLADAIPIFSRLRDANCEFISINQEYLSYTGAMSRYMLHQTIAIAELERGMTSERVAAKLRWIASQGKVPFAIAPIGYRKDPESKNSLVVDEPAAEIVRTVFDLFVAGKLTYAGICDRYPGVFKNRQRLYHILRNPIYIGEIHYGGTVSKGAFPPIVDREIFDRAQLLLEGSRRNYTRAGGRKYEYLLAGLVKCHCGRHMTPYSVNKNGKRFFYYKCTGPDCRNAVNAERLDKMVLDELVRTYTSEDKIRAALQAALADEAERNARRRGRLADAEKALSEAKEREGRIARMFLDGLVDRENKSYWNAELAKARGDRERTEEEMRAIQAPTQEIDIDAAMPALMRAAAEWAQKIAAGEVEGSVRRNLVMFAVRGCVCVRRDGNHIAFRVDMVMSSRKVWRAGSDLIITAMLDMLCGRWNVHASA